MGVWEVLDPEGNAWGQDTPSSFSTQFAMYGGPRAGEKGTEGL